jgi:hypothetical protein
LAFLAFTASEAGRGRVQLGETGVLSDWGTPLRGCFWAADYNGGRRPGSIDVLAKLKDLGFNALHLWLECTYQTPGCHASTGDLVVEWCRQLGLYVVLCHGGCNNNAMFDYASTVGFWEFYAPRYADEEHVIYEIQNEPGWGTCVYGDDVIAMEQDCYRIIREHAPETHMMFLTYSNISCGSEPILRDCERLGPEIDWSNASVAYHGYKNSGAASVAVQREAILTCASEGYMLTCTEFPSNNFDLIQLYEETGISYFHFQGAEHIDGYIRQVVNSGISWAPDYGSWPQQHVDQSVEVRTPQSGVLIRQATPPAFHNPAVNCSRRFHKSQSGPVYDLTGRRLRSLEAASIPAASVLMAQGD